MKLEYDVVKDFEPIALLATSPMLIVAKKATPANDLKELIAWLRANAEKASAGTGGLGSPLHLAGVRFQQQTETRFALVPYRGGVLAVQDLLSGQIDLMIDVVSTSLPHVQKQQFFFFFFFFFFLCLCTYYLARYVYARSAVSVTVRCGWWLIRSPSRHCS